MTILLTAKQGHVLFAADRADDFNVEKTLMSPNDLNSKDKIATIAKDKKFYKIKKKIKKYQKFIKENFDYVGDNFAYEARAIHYNKDKKSKRIFDQTIKSFLKV